MEYSDEQLILLEKIEELQKNENLSQNAVAKKIGISATALSQIKKGTYSANPDGFFEIISAYFDVKKMAESVYSEVDYADTSISRQVCEIVSICQIKGGISVIAGDAGIGKTKGVQKFISDHPTNSFLITINPCLTNIKYLLQEIADKIGANQEHCVNEIWHSIVKKIPDGTVLIFDEAQHLTAKAIEVLRSFSDYFNEKKQTLGICFVGNIETVSRIGGKKAEFAQITNRTKQKKIFRNTDIQREDICRLFPLLTAENKQSEIEFLLQVSRTQQALRGAVNLFSNAYDNENYTYSGLLAMADFMDIKI